MDYVKYACYDMYIFRGVAIFSARVGSVGLVGLVLHHVLTHCIVSNPPLPSQKRLYERGPFRAACCTSATASHLGGTSKVHLEYTQVTSHK